MATIRRRLWTTAKGEERESWQCDFADAQGKRRARQFSTKKAADQFMVQARAQVAEGTYSPDSESPTVAAAAAQWLERCEREQLEPITIGGYRSLVKTHIAPHLGRRKLSRLTRPMIEGYVDELLANGLSRVMARRALGALVSLIGEQQRRGAVAQNVARGVVVRIASRHKKRVAIPSKAEVKTLLDAANGRDRALLVLAIFTGMRISEIRGLRWQDCDLDARILRVRQRADQGGRIGSLKSAGSRRDIPMAPMVGNTLREWLVESGERDGLVFPGRKGAPLSHNAVRATLGRAHRFRHFFASWLIDQNFGPKRVSALLGHSSIAITFDVYGHLFPQEDDHEKFAAGELALVGRDTVAT
jgi:integrase